MCVELLGVIKYTNDQCLLSAGHSFLCGSKGLFSELLVLSMVCWRYSLLLPATAEFCEFCACFDGDTNQIVTIKLEQICIFLREIEEE